MKPILYIVIPCYNEEEVLPVTAPMFLSKIKQLIDDGKVEDESRILFVNDGSKDETWKLIKKFAGEDSHFKGISQSRMLFLQDLWKQKNMQILQFQLTVTVRTI